MAVQLDHIIVPTRDKHAAAKSLADLLDVPSAESLGEFVAVFVNEGLTLDFAQREGFASRPHGDNDFSINARLGGKNLYWQDADGHLWEILTVSYARRDSPFLAAAP